MRKAIWLIILLVLSVATFAVFFPEPWGNDVDAGGFNLNNVNNVTANFFNGNGSALTDLVATSIDDGAVTNSKIAVNAVNSTQIIDGQVQTSDLGSESVTNVKIAGSAINASQIIGEAVTNVKIAANAINASQLIGESITNTKVSGDAINSSQIIDGAIVGADLADTIITDAKVSSVNWTQLKNYPVACPASGAITLLNDSVTCSDLWVDVAGDTMTGNLNTLNVTVSGAGLFKLLTNTTLMTCNEVNAGGLYWDNASKSHFGCNSSDWVALY